MMSQNELSAFRPEPSRYKYEALDQSKHRIRLIRFLSPRGADHTVVPIELSLKVYNLEQENAPPYIGLSYTWGTHHPDHIQGPDRDVFIDGAAHQVTENLWEFFRHYALVEPGDLVLKINEANASNRSVQPLFDAPEYFWVDQICIDQDDMEDKQNEVSKMGEIYSGATFVLSWLGPHDETSVVACKVLQKAQEGLYPQDRSWRVPRDGNCSSLFERTYWRRLWIIQELVLPLRENVYILGPSVFSMAWYTVRNIAQYRGFGLKWSSHWRNDFYDSIQELRATRPCDHTTTLWDTIIKAYQYTTGFEDYVHPESSQWRCSRPQDTIYGLMGLVSPKFRLDVDYSKSTRDLYIDVLRSGISLGKDALTFSDIDDGGLSAIELRTFLLDSLRESLDLALGITGRDDRQINALFEEAKAIFDDC